MAPRIDWLTGRSIQGAKFDREHLRRRREVEKCACIGPLEAAWPTGMNESNPLPSGLLQPLAFLSVQELPDEVEKRQPNHVIDSWYLIRFAKRAS